MLLQACEVLATAVVVATGRLLYVDGLVTCAIIAELRIRFLLCAHHLTLKVEFTDTGRKAGGNQEMSLGKKRHIEVIN